MAEGVEGVTTHHCLQAQRVSLCENEGAIYVAETFLEIRLELNVGFSHYYCRNIRILQRIWAKAVGNVRRRWGGWWVDCLKGNNGRGRL